MTVYYERLSFPIGAMFPYILFPTCSLLSLGPLLDFGNVLGIALDYIHPARRFSELLSAKWLPGNHDAFGREKDIGLEQKDYEQPSQDRQPQTKRQQHVAAIPMAASWKIGTSNFEMTANKGMS